MAGLVAATTLVAWAAEPPALPPDPVVAAVQKVLPSVVNISTERLVSRPYRDPFEDFWRQFFGRPVRPDVEGAQSLGSGVIVDEDGWIVTNFHVVQRASKIHIVRADGSKFEAQYISGDKKNDLALLKIESPQPLPAVEIAAEREPLLGETVIAVGNPFGLEQTVTRGVISAKNRKYKAEDIEFDDILQTDASINPGNSGGPLIDTQGELVGINMAILSQAQGIGFAVPARRVASLLATWFTPEKRARQWLGARFGMTAGRLAVVDVQPGSPAAKAGLQPGDRVTRLDGRPYRDLLRFQRALIHRPADGELKFELERDGQTRLVGVKLAPLPQVSYADLMQKRFGLGVQPLTPELAQAMGLGIAQGLLVADVEKQSPAAEAGFQRGMVITHCAGEEIQSFDRLAELVADLKAGDSVSFVVFISERRGNLTMQRSAGVTLKAR